MHRLVFHFDPISPYAWLAFERLPQALQGLSYVVEHQPVLFGALLKHHAHKGPAEIEPKRAWTYRHVQWLAHEAGVELVLPAVHPFNPLPLLRLALACAPAGGLPNRRIVEAVFRHVWCSGGADAADPARLAGLQRELAPERDPDGDEVKAELRAATDAAAAAGIFGVPTLTCDGKSFWGLDALPMLSAFLRGDGWFDGAAWEGAAQRPSGVRRS